MIPFPNKKYQIIYADPPWSYGFSGTRGKILYPSYNQYIKKVDDYKTMKTKNICDIPIKALTDKNCVLFIWMIWNKLPDVLEVIKSWGFEYKSCAFTWVKKNKKSGSWFWGMGGWTRQNSENCLIATKGKPKRANASIHSILDNNIMEHSEKPPEVRNKIVQLCGDLPRIELFARPPKDRLFADESYKGWDVWGNECQ